MMFGDDRGKVGVEGGGGFEKGQRQLFSGNTMLLIICWLLGVAKQFCKHYNNFSKILKVYFRVCQPFVTRNAKDRFVTQDVRRCAVAYKTKLEYEQLVGKSKVGTLWFYTTVFINHYCACVCVSVVQYTY